MGRSEVKPFNIDVETVEGMVMTEPFIEIQGAMNVRQETQPLEGVHQSSLFISLAQAEKLHGMLGRALEAAKRRGARQE
jgi:hypothetical protein